ncbi:MAG: TAXI family TRAP transporter solute-binding subunit [Treponema sp.]|nr:TAXI family TRAP transporter solute-binding subunit [Treponema sp.]
MRKFLVTALIMVILVGVTACRDKSEQVRMATGGSTGTYYAFGTAVGQILNEKTGIPISVQSTGASRANIQLINAGEIELAIVQNDVMDYAWRGVDLFNGEQITSFNTMAALYAEVCQIVVSASSGIRSVAELRGKEVSVGDAGSGVEFNARQILDAYGLSFDDIGKHNLSFGASADALRDNKIDAFFCVAGAPTPAIIDLATNRDIAILEIDENFANQLIRRYPFYTRFPIPAGSYRGQVHAVMTVAVKATFIVSTRLSEDTVYRLTKNLFENQALIEAAHVKGTELSPAYATEGISVPFHPGAAKYFREIGAIR